MNEHETTTTETTTDDRRGERTASPLSRRSVLRAGVSSAVIGSGLGTASATTEANLERTAFILDAHERPYPWPHPDCGEYSDAHTFIGDQVRWPDGAVGYEVVAGSATSAGIDPAAFQDAAASAFDAWDELIGDITLEPTGTDITVKFGGVNGPARRTFARAVVTWNRSTNEIVNGNVLLEPGVGWHVFSDGEQCPTPTEGPDAYDVQSLLTHEIGHTLGLGHPSLDAANRLLTMFPVPAHRLTYWRSPDGGDVTGIQTLYGTP